MEKADGMEEAAWVGTAGRIGEKGQDGRSAESRTECEGGAQRWKSGEAKTKKNSGIAEKRRTGDRSGATAILCTGQGTGCRQCNDWRGRSGFAKWLIILKILVQVHSPWRAKFPNLLLIRCISCRAPWRILYCLARNKEKRWAWLPNDSER